MHGNIILHPSFHQVLDPCLNILEIDSPHHEVVIPNEMHQFDLLYMPTDSLYGNEYKHILSGIGITSRYKVAKPMRTQHVKDVADMITDIDKVSPLIYPNLF